MKTLRKILKYLGYLFITYWLIVLCFGVMMFLGMGAHIGLNPYYSIFSEQILDERGFKTQYYRIGDDVYYMVEFHPGIRRDFLEGVSSDSFKVLNSEWGIGDTKIHYRGYPVELDINTFETFGCYAKDVEGIYMFSKKAHSAPENIIVTKNLSNINLIDDLSYSPCVVSNSENVFYKDKIITDADPDSFEALTSSWSRDKNHVYVNYQIAEGLDPEKIQTVHRFSQYTQRDFIEDKYIYSGGDIFVPVKEKPFYKKINSDYTIDGDNKIRLSDIVIP